ncbi:SprT-like domain-containing protein [Prevotella denticola]|uniref:SprT-like domain-containing protein n=1 Tax=Prevotella denticola TaxID=28129 RepID=UPI001C5CE2FC|nr:SprT-like domain-containing protein [Prevotella denticola]MBW4759295.1 SprT-like domain-containing protein [Prevotella denticola]
MSSFSKICRQDSSSRPDASGTPEGRSLLERFNRYNTLIFDGRLPVPKLKWSRARTRLGQMACKRKTSLGRTKYYDYTISVSTYYELTEEQTDDVLIHEMIHYSIAYTGLKDTSPHGVIFRSMMEKVNRRFGRHITISVNTRNLQAREQQQHKDYLVLALEMKEGACYLSSVNPSAAGKLAGSLARTHGIAHYAWYCSQDDFFRNMPRVRTLRGRRVSPEIYKALTDKMTLLK